MFSTIPDADARNLSESPLQQVVCQVRFPLELDLQQGGPSASQIHKILEDEYPRFVKEMRAEIQISSDGPKTATTPVCKLSDLRGNWSVVIAPTHVTLEVVGGAYVDWDDLRARYERIIKAAAEVLSIRVTDRLGLRYTNVIDSSSVEGLRGMVGPAFLGPFVDTETTELHQWLGQLHLREAMGSAVLRYGVLIPDGGGLAYKLDTDCYSDEPTEFSVDDVLTRLTAFNDVAFRVFTWAMKPAYLESLTEVPNA